MPAGSWFAVSASGVAILSILIYFRYSDPRNLEAVAFTVDKPPSLDGPLSYNHGLENATLILKDRIVGPESIVVEKDIIYTALADGRIVKIQNNKIVKLARLTKETTCGSYEMEPKCGRPLGLRRYNKDEFLIADAYLGLFLVNIEEGTSRRLIASKNPIDGVVPKFFNDIDFVDDDIFITDSSYKYERRDFMSEMLEGTGNGRVIRYRMSTGESSTILNNLKFPNGIQVLPDKNSFVVAELTRSRILRHYFSGPKKGSTETFASNLPGHPDNVRLSRNGTLWVGLSAVRHAGQFNLLDAAASRPAWRQLVKDVTPSWVWSSLLPHVKGGHGIVLQLSLEGKIISSLHDKTGTIVDVSQVTDGGDKLYLGSYNKKFIAVVDKY